MALGVILVGLVGEAADQHEAPEFSGVEGKAAAGLGAEQDGAEPSRRSPGGGLVLRDQFLDLGNDFGRVLPGDLADHVVDLITGAGRLVDSARTLANARGGLAEDLS